jgi:DNA repair protein RecO (recombination protein O)
MPVTGLAATVLHAQDYLETSRIYRLLSPEAGVISVIARGLRRGGAKATTPVDLFASGLAQVDLRTGRDLHGLRDFEVSVPRLGLAMELRRFAAASALAEAALHFVTAEPSPAAASAVIDGLDALNQAAPEWADAVALSALWRLVGALGFAPSLLECARCGGAVPTGGSVVFHHGSGGVLCLSCSRPFERESGRVVGGRRIPVEARARIAGWLDGVSEGRNDTPAMERLAVRAHQRLLLEFLVEHLSDRRPLRALTAWSGDAGSAL